MYNIKIITILGKWNAPNLNQQDFIDSNMYTVSRNLYDPL